MAHNVAAILADNQVVAQGFDAAEGQQFLAGVDDLRAAAADLDNRTRPHLEQKLSVGCVAHDLDVGVIEKRPDPGHRPASPRCAASCPRPGLDTWCDTQLDPPPRPD